MLPKPRPTRRQSLAINSGELPQAPIADAPIDDPEQPGRLAQQYPALPLKAPVRPPQDVVQAALPASGKISLPQTPPLSAQNETPSPVTACQSEHNNAAPRHALPEPFRRNAAKAWRILRPLLRQPQAIPLRREDAGLAQNSRHGRQDLEAVTPEPGPAIAQRNIAAITPLRKHMPQSFGAQVHPPSQVGRGFRAESFPRPERFHAGHTPCDVRTDGGAKTHDRAEGQRRIILITAGDAAAVRRHSLVVSFGEYPISFKVDTSEERQGPIVVFCRDLRKTTRPFLLPLLQPQVEVGVQAAKIALGGLEKIKSDLGGLQPRQLLKTIQPILDLLPRQPS